MALREIRTYVGDEQQVRLLLELRMNDTWLLEIWYRGDRVPFYLTGNYRSAGVRVLFESVRQYCYYGTVGRTP